MAKLFNHLNKTIDEVNMAFDNLLNNKTSNPHNLKKAIQQLENISLLEDEFKDERESGLYYYIDTVVLFLYKYRSNTICKEILNELKNIFNEEVICLISPNKKEDILIKLQSLYAKLDNLENNYKTYFPTYEELLINVRSLRLSKDINDKISKIILE